MLCMWSVSVLLLTLASADSKTSSKSSLTLSPSSITLRSPYDGVQEIVNLANATGNDVTPKCSFTVENPLIAEVDPSGRVRPKAKGKTRLIVRYEKTTASVPVIVGDLAAYGAPKFIRDIEPILARSGCNSGACHGAGQGKGGFKLSLLGYDPALDYDAIVKSIGGRRINRIEPFHSLILKKPVLDVPHKGGKRLRADSADYATIADWIAFGAPSPEVKPTALTKVWLMPSHRSLAKSTTQKFRVLALYADGLTRDVTDQALFNATEEAVAVVTPEGVAKSMGQGEASVVVRYMGLVASARVTTPFNNPTKWIPSAKVSSIDSLIGSKLADLGLSTSTICNDSDFLRRAFLDVIGILPTPQEARMFLFDSDPNKRRNLIDSLLQRTEYIDLWSMKWGDLLRSNRKTLSDKGMIAFNHWIREAVAENKPWDQFAKEVLLSQGNSNECGPVNFFRTAGSANELAETTSQVFLGVRIQCAKCHNHPYEKWTQNQYYQMSAFFARIKRKPGATPSEQIVLAGHSGEVNHPKTAKVMAPCALDAPPIPESEASSDRRLTLANWMTSKDNPFFGRIIVNRVWRHLMGRGLVEPVDDMRATNPSSNEPLLSELAKSFVENGFDLKWLIREITSSKAYQRSSSPLNGNERDVKFYSHALFKRLGAEQLMDAIASVTGAPEKFAGYPSGTRATQLLDAATPSYFLDLFGKPARNVTCECERTDDPSLGQVLHLMNNAGLNGRIASKTGRIATLIDSKAPVDKIVEDLYLAAYGRMPNLNERKIAATSISDSKDKQKSAEDLLWAMMNSKEFVFNH